jgi:hypothetical protein
MNKLVLFLLLSATSFRASAATNELASIHDETGRELVLGGFVALTEDGKGNIRYTPDDYRRMVRMGANIQVIRTTLGRLGGWPGKAGDPAYFSQLDEMVRLGKEAGLKTVFKLVVYDIRPFGNAQWDAIYHNTNGAQDALVAAWKKVWVRYQNEPSVFGYDLLNEPQRGMDPDEERCSRKELLPTLRRLADALHAVSPGKWALYQPLFRDAGDGVGPFQPMKEAFGRDRVIYAPHLYTKDLKFLTQTLDRYQREAALSKAPLLLGEWGPSAPLAADTSPQLQASYTKVYQATANALDQRGIGGIKAWFCGSRSPLKSKHGTNLFTWAIFSDTNAVGHVERKFITDPIARPRPLVVAGKLERYGFDFETRIFEMSLNTDPGLGATGIFVPAERHYPGGFRVEVGPGLTLALAAGAGTLRPVRAADSADQEQAKQIRWDAAAQHLIIDNWVGAVNKLTLRVLPGISK